jgi:hypothetical protein
VARRSVYLADFKKWGFLPGEGATNSLLYTETEVHFDVYKSPSLFLALYQMKPFYILVS